MTVTSFHIIYVLAIILNIRKWFSNIHVTEAVIGIFQVGASSGIMPIGTCNVNLNDIRPCGYKQHNDTESQKDYARR